MRMLGLFLFGWGLGLIHPGLAFIFCGLICLIGQVAHEDKEEADDANTPGSPPPP